MTGIRPGSSNHSAGRSPFSGVLLIGLGGAAAAGARS